MPFLNGQPGTSLLAVKAVVVVVLAAAVCSCASDPSQSKVDREQAAMGSCKQEVVKRSGSSSTPEMPWRITTQRDGKAIVVSIWTHTPRSAQRPSGAADYVCRR